MDISGDGDQHDPIFGFESPLCTGIAVACFEETNQHMLFAEYSKKFAEDLTTGMLHALRWRSKRTGGRIT